MNQPATRARGLLVIAGRVHTLDPARPIDTSPAAVLIRDGVIVALGTLDEVQPLAGDAALLDLPDAALTPGLTDAHIHLSEWALARRQVDLSRARTPEQAAQLVAQHAAATRDAWVRGRGWSLHRFGGRLPTRTLLDDVVSDRPVVLQSHDMHALWVNGVALERAGIGADTRDPEGGRIVRDDAGRPTGLLLENAAALIAACLPLLTLEETADAVLEAQAELHGLGITSVHSLPAIHIAEPEPLGVLEALRARGRLRLRVLQHLPLRQLDEAIRLGLRSGFGGAWLRVGGVKMFLDGTLGSRTAWMVSPYADADGCGISVLDAGEFRYHVRRAAKAGIASTVHAIGDAAVALAIDVLADLGQRVERMPHRIEHVQCLPAGRAADLARADITCSVQPSHLLTDWPQADRAWGPERAGRTYAFRTLLEAGARLAFGSDAPVEPPDPRLALLAAVLRADPYGRPEGGWHPAQRIDRFEAFRASTVGPAAAAGDAGGVLQPGAPADLVAWTPDPFEMPPEELATLRCVATIVGGVVVHTT